MCFPVRSCLFCVGLDTATKIICFVYVVLSSMLSLLYLVPLVVLRGALPLERMYFYSVLALLSVTLVVASCLLIYAEFWKKPKLMWPWVMTAWCTSVLLGAVCVMGLAAVAFLAGTGTMQETAVESGVISAYFLHAALLFYCACVVDSRRIQLKEEKYAEANKRLMCPIMYHVNSV